MIYVHDISGGNMYIHARGRILFVFLALIFFMTACSDTVNGNGQSSSEQKEDSTKQTTIYSTKTDFSSWNINIKIGASKCSSLKAGYQIVFTTTASTALPTPSYLNLQLCDSNWKKCIAGVVSGGMMDEGTITPYAVVGTVSYTLTQADAESFASNGFIVQGYGLAVTNIAIALPTVAMQSASVDFAKKLTVGWNLGNTLDAASDGVSNSGVSSETSWNAPATTEAMIKGIASAGFKTIRIPITWHNHMSDASTYKIDTAWMARVKTVVDWAYDAGLYVIINVHHDNAAATGVVAGQGYYPALPDKTVSETFVSKVWTQIATIFNNDYDEHLVFEVLNEPRLRGNTNNHEWWYDRSSDECKTALTLIENYEQKGLDAIRATGGNNATVRFVMVPSMCASSTYTSDFDLPTDSLNDKLLVSVHAYSPYNFAMYNSTSIDTTFDDADKTSLNTMFKTWYDAFTAKGIGVVIGETSASNKDNLAERVKWATYYFGTALNTYGIPSILWDNMAYAPSTTSGEQHGYYNRSTHTWYFPTIITAAMDAVGVTGYTVN